MTYFHYKGIFMPEALPETTWHQFELYPPMGDEPIGTYIVPIAPHEGSDLNEKVALAHRRLAENLRSMADLAEASSLRWSIKHQT